MNFESQPKAETKPPAQEAVELSPEQREQAELAAGMADRELGLAEKTPTSPDPAKHERRRQRASIFALGTFVALAFAGAPKPAEAGWQDVLKDAGRIAKSEAVGYGQETVYRKLEKERKIIETELRLATRDLDKAKFAYAKNQTDENRASVTLAEDAVQEAAAKLREHREKAKWIAIGTNRAAKEIRY